MEGAALAFTIILLMLYFLPGIIASQRGHANQASIWTINLLLGWTFLGWIAALVWSITSDQKHGANVQQGPMDPQPARSRTVEHATPADDRVECPECAELIKANARKCRYCGAQLKPSTSDQPTPSQEAERPTFGPRTIAAGETVTCPGCGYVRHGQEDAPPWQCPNCLKAYNKISI